MGMCGLRLSWFRLECRAQHHDEWTSAVLNTQTRVCPRRLSVDRVRVAVDPLVQQAHPAAVSPHRHGGGDSLPAPRCDWCIGKVFAGHDRRRWWRWPLDGVPVGRYFSCRRAGCALLPPHHARHVGRCNLVTKNKWVLEVAPQRVQRQLNPSGLGMGSVTSP